MPKFRNMFLHHIYLLLQFDNVSGIKHTDPTTISPNDDFPYPKAQFPFGPPREEKDVADQNITYAKGYKKLFYSMR